jgi:hypothetical protein
MDPKRTFVNQVVGRELVQHVATALAKVDIDVLPLKGVWLQACVCGPDDTRLITDVDLLVRESAFALAVAELERGGFRARNSNSAEVTLVHPAFELPLDLHRQLFTRRVFRLPTHALFERSRSDSTAFGVRVQLPHPHDALAHLIGHFVKSQMRPDDPQRLSDFVVIAARCDLRPDECARHLHAVGMGRAARYVLHELAYRRSHPLWRAVLAALPPDPLGERLANIARRICAGRAGGRRLPVTLSGFMLDRSLAAGALALVLRTWDRRHDRRTTP